MQIIILQHTDSPPIEAMILEPGFAMSGQGRKFLLMHSAGWREYPGPMASKFEAVDFKTSQPPAPLPPSRDFSVGFRLPQRGGYHAA